MPRPWDMEISAPSIGDLLEAAAACPYLLLPDERFGLNRGTHRLATGDLFQPGRYCPGIRSEAWLRYIRSEVEEACSAAMDRIW